MENDRQEKQRSAGRRKLREAVFKVLFSIDFGNRSKTEEIGMILSSISEEEPGQFTGLEKEITHYVDRIYAHLEEIDGIIKANILNWSWERLLAVDKNILRLATYELLFEEFVPIEVTLNEAVEIAKAYGTDKSGKFVNGILDVIAKKFSSEEKRAL